VVLVAAFANRDRIRLKIASVYASVPPKAAQAPLLSKRTPRDFWADAPWALSALPECFEQIQKTSGSRSYVEAHIPSGYARAPSGTVLRYNDCVVIVRNSDIVVTRGKDRFFVPNPTQLYRSGSSIALVRENGPHAEVRIYNPSTLP